MAFEPNVVIKIAPNGDMRAHVAGKSIVGQTRVVIDGPTGQPSMVTIEVLAKLVRFEHEEAI